MKRLHLVIVIGSFILISACGNNMRSPQGTVQQTTPEPTQPVQDEEPTGFSDYTAWVDQGIVYTAPAGDAYYPSVLYDANGFGTGTPVYKMWYTNGADAFLSTSTDGVAWSAAPTTMVGLGVVHHVQVLYDASCFGQVPCNAGTTKYKVWYWDVDAVLGLYDISSIATAESVDGVNWINAQALTQDAVLQLIVGGGVGWNRGSYGPVSLFYQASATNIGTEPWDYSYVMYYNGTDGSHEVTGLAYSSDGIYWNAYVANPVLSGTLEGLWECASAVYGTVYKDSSGYHYFYSGRGITDGVGGCTFPSSFEGIGYASSSDGKTWTRSSDNIIFHISDGETYRDQRVYAPSVIDDGSGVLKMYYSAKGSISGVKKIGMATLQ